MIRQDSTRSITLTTSQVGIEFTFSGIARAASAAPALITNNTTVATGPVTVSAAPAAGTTNEWDHITLKNTYAGANTVEMKSVGANTTHDFYGVLQQNESAEYVHGNGWKTLDAAGQEKITVGGTAGNFAVGANLTVAGTSVFTSLGTFNAGALFPTGTAVTGAGTAQVTGFATVSATNLTGTLNTAAQPNVTSLGTLTSFAVGLAAPTINTLTQAFVGALSLQGSGGEADLGHNFYNNSGYKRRTSDGVVRLSMNDTAVGDLNIYNAPTGAADSAIATWTKTLTITAAGAVSTNGGSLTAGAGSFTTGAFSALGAFAASDKYVVVDSSGNFHKSAIGPAS